MNVWWMLISSKLLTCKYYLIFRLAEQQSCLEFFELIKMPEFSKAKTLFFAIKSN